MDEHNDSTLRAQKVEQMTEALNYWTGSYVVVTKRRLMPDSKTTHYDGSRAFARQVIGNSCNNEGSEGPSTLQEVEKVLKLAGLKVLSFIGSGLSLALEVSLFVVFSPVMLWDKLTGGTTPYG